MKFFVVRHADGRKHLKVLCGERYLIVRQGNYSHRRVLPFIQKGPFRTWVASLRWCQIEHGLRRWI